jgi:alpha-beta hydrolase superfamily lysophospholipase
VVFLDPFYLFSAPTPPTDDKSLRDRLRDKMALSDLQHREVFHIDEVHYERYPANNTSAAHSSASKKLPPLMVFLPGLGTYSELYARFLYGVSQQGFEVISLDYPGHGYSGGRRGEYSVTSVQGAVHALLDRFHADQRKVVLWGYSIGSLLALASAEADERVDQVITQTLILGEYPPDWLHQMGWSWLGASAPWFPSGRVSMRSMLDFDQLIRLHPAKDEILKDPLMIYEYPLSTLNSLFSYRLQRNRDPNAFSIHVFHGDQDEVLPISYTQRLSRELPYDVSVTQMSGGHMLLWDDPQTLIDLTVSVLR